jgi:glycosyltransferase involved in cell wall biosynthesis
VGNVDEMVANALKILKDHTVLNKFKENALSVAERFDIKNILPLYEELYQKAINKFV